MCFIDLSLSLSENHSILTLNEKPLIKVSIYSIVTKQHQKKQNSQYFQKFKISNAITRILNHKILKRITRILIWKKISKWICHVPRCIRMYYRHRLGLEKNLGILLKQRKPPIEKRGITTSHAAGDCAMRDVTKNYNIKRTRRQGKTSLVSRI